MDRKYHLGVAALSLLMMIILTACGQSSGKTNATSSTSSGENEAKDFQDYEPVTIETKDRTIQFNEMPQRVVTFDLHPAEIMIALGLEKYIVGTVSHPNQILPEYREVYSQIPVISSDLYTSTSQEAVLEANPDFVYSGWDSTFQEDSIGTVEQLEELGIKAYAQQSTNIIGPTLEDVYEDIRNIGRIFKVEERADKLIKSLNDSIDDVKQRIESQIGEEENPFVFLCTIAEKMHHLQLRRRY
ncbi:hypothetical protein DCC39_07090 [Pueribacillus theae]|uniref:Fe/B12 periplasmic-binding domain-containing protein n=1 Tax=Pueribacillus theae TaxID=2171751 RepID=A0A2U1K5B7_9BACI|nr:ABC transporter substrate-binding protein [Pueribacillus theae]PWA12193.1 hypothetical protein DCC39_07090 [Pueribacillus theae]